MRMAATGRWEAGVEEICTAVRQGRLDLEMGTSFVRSTAGPFTVLESATRDIRATVLLMELAPRYTEVSVDVHCRRHLLRRRRVKGVRRRLDRWERAGTLQGAMEEPATRQPARDLRPLARPFTLGL